MKDRFAALVATLSRRAVPLFPLAMVGVGVALGALCWLIVAPVPAGTAGATAAGVSGSSADWSGVAERVVGAVLPAALLGGVLYATSRRGWLVLGGVVLALALAVTIDPVRVGVSAAVLAASLAWWAACANGRGTGDSAWSLSGFDLLLLALAAGIFVASGSSSLAIGVAVAAAALLVFGMSPTVVIDQLNRKRAIVAAIVAAVGCLVVAAAGVPSIVDAATWLLALGVGLFLIGPIEISRRSADRLRQRNGGRVVVLLGLLMITIGFVARSLSWQSESDASSFVVPIGVLVAVHVVGALITFFALERVATPAADAVTAAETAAATEAARRAAMLRDGVNLVGYHRAVSGLGVAVRQIRASLEAAGVAVSIVDLDLSQSPTVGDEFVGSARTGQPVRSTTLAVVTAPELPAAAAAHPDVFAVDRVIGYWFWELESVPETHRAATDLVDEIWAPTTFIAEAYRSFVDAATPVVHQPMHLAEPRLDRGLQARWRQRLAPADEFVFLVTLDLFSVVERKNPFAAVAAFAQAVDGATRPARLVIKTLNGNRRPESLQRIRDSVDASSVSSRIELIDDQVSDVDMAAMLAASDCLVSLHRGEGLGLHLAAAMWLGTPVVATRYSGNLDFMDDDNSVLVEAVLVPARHGEGAYTDDLSWAEADIDVAAERMQVLIDDADLCRRIGMAAQASMALAPSAARHGVAYAAALDGLPGTAVQPVPDFNEVLHWLRTAALGGMPSGADRLLSVGCAGRWYFDWVESAYGPVREHVGIEFFSPRPDDLPDWVTWIVDTAANMASVADASADLLFSGQNIEHLWPSDVVGFLAESNRVIRQGGTIVVDSPNRIVTERLGWSQPEHTIEFTATEIVELLDIAGFAVHRQVGLWDCRGRSSLEPGSTAETRERAVLLESDRIDDAFVWWVEAERVGGCDLDRLRRRVEEIFALAWPERLSRRVIHDEAGWSDAGCALPAGASGVIVHGPHTPLSAGRYEIEFEVEADGPVGEIVGSCMVQAGLDRLGIVDVVGVGRRETKQIQIAIDLPDMTFGVHARVDATGVGSLYANPTFGFLPGRPVGH